MKNNFLFMVKLMIFYIVNFVIFKSLYCFDENHLIYLLNWLIPTVIISVMLFIAFFRKERLAIKIMTILSVIGMECIEIIIVAEKLGEPLGAIQ